MEKANGNDPLPLTNAKKICSTIPTRILAVTFAIPGEPEFTAAVSFEDFLAITPNHQLFSSIGMDGLFSATKYTLVRNNALVFLESERTGAYIPAEKIMYQIQCMNQAPAEILWNGTRLPQILDEDHFQTANAGWHYHHSTKICCVKCGDGRDLAKMVVNFGQFDLIRMDPE